MRKEILETEQNPYSFEKEFTMLWLALLCFCFMLIFPGEAQAGYLDPGAGSTLAQGIAAFIAGLAKFFRKLFGLSK